MVQTAHASESSAHDYDRLMARPDWAPDVLALFLELAALRARRARSGPSPTACTDTFGALGLECRRRRRRRRGSARRWATSTAGWSRRRMARRSSSAPISTRCRRRPPIEPVVGEDGVVRNGGGHDPRRRRQVRRRGDARGDRRAGRGGQAACRRRVAVHGEGGGRAAWRGAPSTNRGSPPGWATSTTMRRRSAR